MTDSERQKLEELNEKVCLSCDHLSASGYIYCNHCLHGGCSRAPEDLLKKVKAYRKQLEKERNA